MTKPSTYADLFEVMHYGRPLDVLPYIISFRVRPPLVDPSGPEPYFVLLDTDEERTAFETALQSPLQGDSLGRLSLDPLLQWNEQPAQLTADELFTSPYYPPDDAIGWPFLWVVAFPSDARSGPAIEGLRAAGEGQPARNRYEYRQMPMSERFAFMEQIARRGNLTILSGPEWKNFPFLEVMNRRPPGRSQ
jgi:hypothetical protein